MSTLGEDLQDEEARLRVRAIHATRPKEPMTLVQACELSRRAAEALDWRTHWIISGVLACGRVGGTGVGIETPFDTKALKLTCSECAARFLAAGCA